MRTLITGGGGFVGANLARDLIGAGDDVHLLLRPGHRSWRLSDIRGKFVPHLADLRDAGAVRRAVEVCKPETIFHLATHGAYPNQSDRATVLATNLQGTVNLFEALARHDYRAFVHAGSSSEYGHKPGPIREDDGLEPRTDYAVGKAAASLFALAEARRGRPVCVVRLFSAYGPWEEPTRLVPYVIGCCLRGEDPRVTPGGQPRDFIHVEDVAALLKLAAELPAAHGQVLHAGTGVQHSVRAMIETIVRVSGAPVTPEYGTAEPRPDEPASWVAGIDRTRALTGWEPRHDLTSGVEGTWQWYRRKVRTEPVGWVESSRPTASDTVGLEDSTHSTNSALARG